MKKKKKEKEANPKPRSKKEERRKAKGSPKKHAQPRTALTGANMQELGSEDITKIATADKNHVLAKPVGDAPRTAVIQKLDLHSSDDTVVKTTTANENSVADARPTHAKRDDDDFFISHGAKSDNYRNSAAKREWNTSFTAPQPKKFASNGRPDYPQRQNFSERDSPRAQRNAHQSTDKGELYWLCYSLLLTATRSCREPSSFVASKTGTARNDERCKAEQTHQVRMI